MGKGQATQQEITSGLRAVGNLASLGAARGLRRDSPLAAAVGDAPPPAPGEPRPSSAAPPSPTERVPAPGRGPSPHDPGPAVERPGSPAGRSARTDAVTVPMTADMRSRATLLAAELQRRRTARSARLTANSVFRVAIQSFLERFDLTQLEAVNSEEELLSLIRRHWPPAPPATGRPSP